MTTTERYTKSIAANVAGHLRLESIATIGKSSPSWFEDRKSRYGGVNVLEFKTILCWF
jgi:hypothetical protein